MFWKPLEADFVRLAIRWLFPSQAMQVSEGRPGKQAQMKDDPGYTEDISIGYDERAKRERPGRQEEQAHICSKEDAPKLGQPHADRRQRKDPRDDRTQHAVDHHQQVCR